MTDDLRSGSLHPGGGGTCGGANARVGDPVEDEADIFFDEDLVMWVAVITRGDYTVTRYGNSRSSAIASLKEYLDV